MKKSIFVLLLASSNLMQTMEMTNSQKDSTSAREEKFERFEQLPKDIQNEVINTAWSNIDNTENFQKELLDWENVYNYHLPKLNTSYTECLKYGFDGETTPIYFYTLKDGSPIIQTVGNIVQGYPANNRIVSFIPLAKELSVDMTTERLTKIFIHGLENKIYSATLINKANPFGHIKNISSSCFSALGDVAIIWSSQLLKNLVTILPLDDIKKNKIIDLNLNPINLQTIPEKILKDSTKTTAFYKTIKGAIFQLDGSKLGIDIIDYSLELKKNKNMYLKNCYHSIQYVNDVNVTNKKPLTPTEKAKRLGIETKDVKDLVKKKGTTNKQPSSNIRFNATTGLGAGALLGGLPWYYYKK